MTKLEKYSNLPKEERHKKIRGAGYENYPEFGWIKEDRLARCIKYGLIKDVNGEYMLTKEGAIRNVWMYIHGGVNLIKKRTSSDIHRSKIEKAKVSVDEAFSF